MRVTVDGPLGARRHRQGRGRSRSSAASAPPAAPATRSSSPAARIRALSMEGRMTVCNMAIEAGARAGMVAVGRHHHRVPEGTAVRARRARVGARGRVLAHAEERPGREVRPRGDARRARDQAARHLGHLARDGGERWTTPCPTRTRKRMRCGARAWSARSSTWV